MVYAPGYFLADTERFTSVTMQIKQAGDGIKTTANGGKYAPMGMLVKDGATTLGILYEDVDVTNGDMPGAVVTSGIVYKDRLPAATQAAEEELKALGIMFIKLNASEV